MEKEKLIYSVHEVAKMLHSNINYIYLLIEKGILPAIKLKSIKVRKVDLDNFLAGNLGKDLSDIDNIGSLCKKVGE